MRPTGKELQKYVGGQMEIQNHIEEYLYRGEVQAISMDNDNLIVRFSWLAKGIGYPPLPDGWIRDAQLDYAAGLKGCSFSDIGNDRICINFPITRELAVLYPPEGSKLDPSKIKDLKLE
jgi:hypothetical protein